MRGLNVLRTMGIAILLLAAGAWPQADVARAYDTWKGEVTTNINLRRMPGLNGRIITGLEAGEHLTVMDASGDWLQVVVDGTNYGYRGWVYGTYVREMKTTQTQPVAADATVTEAASPPADEVAAAAPAVTPQPQAAPATKPAPTPVATRQAPATPSTPRARASTWMSSASRASPASPVPARRPPSTTPCR